MSGLRLYVDEDAGENAVVHENVSGKALAAGPCLLAAWTATNGPAASALPLTSVVWCYPPLA